MNYTCTPAHGRTLVIEAPAALWKAIGHFERFTGPSNTALKLTIHTAEKGRMLTQLDHAIARMADASPNCEPGSSSGENP